jgi:hypothetical protein
VADSHERINAGFLELLRRALQTKTFGGVDKRVPLSAEKLADG